MNQAAIAVLTKALTLLWDGEEDRYYVESGNATYKEKHGCHVVTWANESIDNNGDILFSQIRWVKAEEKELVKELHAKISNHIGGYDTASQYLRSKTGEWPDNATVQAFRKEMLETILARYKAQEKIRILEEVKALRQGGGEHSSFVCWNIDQVLSERVTDESRSIKRDIDNYIEGHLTVRIWLSEKHDTALDNDDEIVLKTRLEMIDALIERYKAELAV